MSRKNKTLRAFLHQNQNPTIEQVWDAAWKHAQKTFYARSMQDMEKQIADLQAERDLLREQLDAMEEYKMAARHLIGIPASVGICEPIEGFVARPQDILPAVINMALKIEALQAECERLRTCLAETTGVAVTMLYESHKADTIKEFTVEQLSQMVETTKHLADANIQVEKV